MTANIWQLTLEQEDISHHFVSLMLSGGYQVCDDMFRYLFKSEVLIVSYTHTITVSICYTYL